MQREPQGGANQLTHNPPAAQPREAEPESETPLGRAVRRAHGDEAELEQLVRNTPPHERIAAHLTLVRELGQERAAALWAKIAMPSAPVQRKTDPAEGLVETMARGAAQDGFGGGGGGELPHIRK